ncbi:MAG: type I-B CRISPR-associated protein Cas7/Cst2/DevR [Candidatus Woesearchaeota archaeon]
MNNLKGINIVWLSETDLTNLNSGEGESNFVDVKKYMKNNIEYPYVSGQAMRFYLKESIRRNLEEQYMCIPDDQGETCGDVNKCINCDLFGFMTTESGKGALTRVSPLKMSPAQGLLPFDSNANIDFLTRKHRAKESGKLEGDIVNVEIGSNIYKSGVSIDILRVGAEEKVDENARTINLEPIVDDSTKKDRIKRVIDGIRFISDYSKQSRLLTDFTPDIIAISFQNKYSHRLQKLFDMDENRNLNLNRLKSILNDVSNYSDTLIFGMVSGLVNNEEEVLNALKEMNIEVLTPDAAIKKAESKV